MGVQMMRIIRCTGKPFPVNIKDLKLEVRIVRPRLSLNLYCPAYLIVLHSSDPHNKKNKKIKK